jgi:hypothetical protein
MARFKSKTRLKATGVLIAAICFAALTPAASRADFIVDVNPPVVPSDKLFFTKATDTTSFSGHVGAQNSGPVVNGTTTGAVNVANGFSSITPVKGGKLTSLTFTPANANLFDDFNFRGQLLKPGVITVTVQDNQGDPAQTIPISIKTTGDFTRVGIVAKVGSGETIKSVTITDSNGFKSVKQVQFSHVVPEPATLALFLSGLPVLGLGWLRRARRNKK